MQSPGLQRDTTGGKNQLLPRIPRKSCGRQHGLQGIPSAKRGFRVILPNFSKNWHEACFTSVIARMVGRSVGSTTHEEDRGHHQAVQAR
jgi:hypothetical protein